MSVAGRTISFMPPVLLVIIIFAITFSLYFTFRNFTEEQIRSTLLEQYQEKQIEKTTTLSRSIGADLNVLMTKLEVLAESAPVQRGDFSGEATDSLMKRIYEESNMVTRVEGIGLSNSYNIVMNVYQPEIDKNLLIGRNMSSQPYAIEARLNLPNSTFTKGYQTIVNSEGQRVALLHPIFNSDGVHSGWARTAVDASRFFERYGNIRNVESEYFMVLDKNSNILVSPLTHLEGKNFFAEEVQSGFDYREETRDLFHRVLSGQSETSLASSAVGERMITGLPIAIRGEPVYFMFLSTPTSSIYLEIEGALFAQKTQTIILLFVSASVTSILFLVLSRMNIKLRNAVRERTVELENASTKLATSNDELQLRNQQLIESNRVLAEKESELQRAIARVLEIDKEKSEFSAMITHELKTPLVSIIGYGNMLLKGKLGDLTPIQRQKFQIMYNDAERLVTLIQDILDAQKLELGQLRLETSQTTAKYIIEQTVNSLLPRAESKNIKLDSSVDQDLPFSCDPSRIIQVLKNLVNNGIKFSPSDSTIVIAAKYGDHSVLFDVRDNGIGIRKEDQSRLFTKFYQVDTSLTRQAEGTGLGLVICKGIVEAHKGKIWFTSEEGKGSRFSFSIPVGGVGK